jgi:hypothetical protein
MTIYWPGSNVIKSQGNAFNWHGKHSQIMQHQDMKNTNNAKLQAIGATKKND